MRFTTAYYLKSFFLKLSVGSFKDAKSERFETDKDDMNLEANNDTRRTDVDETTTSFQYLCNIPFLYSFSHYNIINHISNNAQYL